MWSGPNVCGPYVTTTLPNLSRRHVHNEFWWCAQSILFMLGSIVEHILHFDCQRVCLSTPIMKIRMKILVIHNCKLDETILDLFTTRLELAMFTSWSHTLGVWKGLYLWMDKWKRRKDMWYNEVGLCTYNIKIALASVVITIERRKMGERGSSVSSLFIFPCELWL